MFIMIDVIIPVCLATEMDFGMYAKSFGIESVSVETPKDFITAFKEA